MRPSLGLIRDKTFIVSIHASVKDATYADDVSDSDENVSIHASVKDATFQTDRPALTPKFQSTHL